MGERRADEITGPPVWRDASARLRANGYQPIPLSWESGNPIGPWCAFPVLHAPPMSAVAIACRAIGSVASGPGDHASTTADMTALHLDVRDPDILEEIEATLRRRAPVRVSPLDGTLLRPMAVQGPLWPRMQTRQYSLPGEKARSFGYRGHSAAFLGVDNFFAVYALDASRRCYDWRNGDLLSVARHELPAVNAADARRILTTIEEILAKRGELWR